VHVSQISRPRKRPGKRVRVDEIILVPDFSGTAVNEIH
jgi:hypothetical protein